MRNKKINDKRKEERKERKGALLVIH